MGRSVEEEFHQFLVEVPVGLIAHRQVHPGFLIHNALMVGKGIKADLAVIGSHAAVAHAAKAHIGGCQVDDGVVDTAAAEGADLGNVADGLLVLREEIEGQGMGPSVDGFQKCVQRTVGENGQQRPEDLLGASQVQGLTRVGAIFRAAGSVSPPNSTELLSRSWVSRAKCFSLMIFP